MTVKEFIKKLQLEDPNKLVLIENEDYAYVEADIARGFNELDGAIIVYSND